MSLSPNQKPLAPKQSTPNIRSLQAAFEAPQQQSEQSQKHPHAIYPPNAHRSNAGDLAPSANPSSNRISSLSKSIDSVLDTPPTRSASPPNRPLAKFRPSWIGPQPSKPMKTDIAGHMEPATKQRVSIDFASPGLQPPVYIFTSLSDPQWSALEMFPVKQMSGDFTFVRNFDVEEGEYQYKFRLGPGDWWVCDERREVVDDGAGNRNNRIVVKGAHTKAVDSGHASPQRETVTSQSAVAPLESYRGLDPADMANPAGLHPEAPKAQTTEVSVPQHVEPAQLPVQVSENVASPAQEPSEQASHHAESEPKPSDGPKIMRTLPPEDDFETEPVPYTAPLLRHESVSPTSHEQDHAPLFRHESIGLGYNHHEDAAPHPGSGSPEKARDAAGQNPPAVSKVADQKEPTLHPFPTDQQGILEHIQRTHARLPADETDGDVHTGSPASSAAVTDSSPLSMASSLASVNENEEEQEKIREAGEQEAEAEQENGEELDPLKEGKEDDDATEPEDADFEPKIPELKVLVVPKVEKNVEEIMVIERRPSVMEIFGTTNLMAVAVGLLAIIAAVTMVKLFR